MTPLRTPRLLLRPWQESDLAPWAAMNADPEVREHLGEPLTRAQSDASVARFRAEFARRGYGWWAVEVRATGDFIGFAGLDRVDEGLPFTGVEIGWRLARAAWGHGYATEAARAVLAFGFGTLGLPEILAVTTATNVRSQAVMRRIGMTRDPHGDFDDPEAPEGPLRPNVLYRVTRQPHAEDPPLTPPGAPRAASAQPPAPGA
ncbi:GNAT family N-acetyltransferase [Streptomyces sp. P6-2-1]|uniref:GNAT family N-acetyltransferase n=1 Tax=Streptomyces sp. P6-2-1 TaxID=3422591 RepID=UPI003D36DBC2